jgi:sugar lactone lactonase YvrE
VQIEPSGQTRVLASTAGGATIAFADAVVVAKSGKIYLSDATTRFGPAQHGGTFEASVLDILEQSATGRIIEFDPATQATRIVAHGLSFANGLALSADEQHLFVVETGRYRLWRIAVAARDFDVRTALAATKGMVQAPQSAVVVLDNLPGYPDNLMRGLPGPDGKPRIWLGFAKPRSAQVDAMAQAPWLREMTLRLPRALWPIPKPYGHVIALTEDGQITADLQDPSGAYPETTGVTELPDRLLIHSLHAKGLAWMPKP